MDIKAKHRLVGVLILIAGLLVTVIWLSTRTTQQAQTAAFEIPKVPVAQTRLPSEQKVLKMAQKPYPVQEQPKQQSTVAAQLSVAATTAVERKVEGMAKTSKSTKATVSKPKTKSRQASATGQGWFVQLASFSSQQSARNLVNKVRVKKFSATVRSVNSKGKRIYRVIVGPMAKREQAEQLKHQLLKAFKLQGLVLNLKK